MPSGELQAVRYTVLNYLQGLAVRVSLYLKYGLQDMSGRLVLPRDGPVPPGEPAAAATAAAAAWSGERGAGEAGLPVVPRSSAGLPTLPSAGA